jgi:hypothetical protein
MTTSYRSQLPGHVVEGWQVEQLGPIPTEQQLAIAWGFCTRKPIGVEGFAGVACSLRAKGVTVAQQRLITALWSHGDSTGAHQNKLRALVAAGWFAKIEGRPGAIMLTPKGQAKLDQRAMAAGDAPKAKPVAKPKADMPVVHNLPAPQVSPAQSEAITG